jgi:hypothetical protein
MSGRGAHQKKALNILNVNARHELLIAGIKTPASFDKAERGTLVSQRTFAAINRPPLKIAPIALNTLKSLSNQLFTVADENGNIGFAYLDALRKKLGLILSTSATTSRIKAREVRTEDKTTNLMARLAATEAQSVKRQKAYLSLFSAINGLIKNGSLQLDAQERLYRLLENHHAAFANLFDPNITTATSSASVITILHEMENPK